jgi:methenyltetrahydromethanopterin cyclohydrolase
VLNKKKKKNVVGKFLDLKHSLLIIVARLSNCEKVIDRGECDGGGSDNEELRLLT